MPHLVRWHEELGDFGLVVIGPHCQQGSEAEIKGKAQSLGVTFAVTNNVAIVNGRDFSGIPHSFLFDHTGKCLYRGTPAAADARLREAVGKAIVDSMEKTTFSKSIQTLTQALQKGQSPAQVLQKVIPLARGGDPATVADAKLLLEKLTAGGQKKLEQTDELLKEDPVAAYTALLKLPTVFKGTNVATKASAKIAELKKDKNVQAELGAQPILAEIKKVDSQLDAVVQKTSADPKGAEFQKAYGSVLKQMKATLQKMKKSYPQAKATQEAMEIGERYGVAVQ